VFTRLVRTALFRRKARTALAVLAIMTGSAIATAMFTTSFSLNDRMSREFRAFGANIVVLPESNTIDIGLPGMAFDSVTDQGLIQESALWRIKMIPNWSANVLGYAPFLYQVVSATSNATGQPVRVALAGTYFVHVEPKVAPGWTTGLRYIAPWWHVRGGWVRADADRNGSMVGTDVAQRLGLGVGSAFRVEYSNAATRIAAGRDFVVRGIVSTGGNEDGQIFVNLAAAQELSARPGRVHAVFVSALCSACPASMMAKEIQMSMPVRARSVRQLVGSESSVVSGLDSMMFLTSAAALAASALVVTAAMTTGVMERRREIGIMKAVGASGWAIAAVFLAESLVMGLVGGILGLATGIALAQAISTGVFGVAVVISPRVFPLAIGLSVAVALLASALPVRRALGVRPATVLRGD
jgi:putative ABC transport system permease protein